MMAPARRTDRPILVVALAGCARLRRAPALDGAPDDFLTLLRDWLAT